MPHYKDAQGNLHFIEFEDFIFMLPPNAVPISDAEAEQLRAESAPQPTVPAVVTMRQARLALLQNGMLTQVNTAVANMPGAQGDAARIEWEFSSTVERNRPLVQALGAALGLTDAQLDDLFRLAATL